MRCWESFAAHSASAQRKKIAPTYEIVGCGNKKPMANGQRLKAKKNIHQYCWALIARQYLVCDIKRLKNRLFCFELQEKRLFIEKIGYFLDN